MGYGSQDNNTPSTTVDQNSHPAGSSSGTGSPAWTGNPDIGEGHGTAGNDSPVDLPPVPVNGVGVSNGTTVSTEPMDMFAANIERLIQPVRAASEALSPINIAPGAFYHANLMENNINGPNADSGLKQKLIEVLDALERGLHDVSTGVRELSSMFQTQHEANNMTARDLQDAVSSAANDFNAMMEAQGGEGNVSVGGNTANTANTATTTAA
ncbi:hypothetical protein [Streptomyces coerulescens]|uniref:Uncharacterized protein n=1 Tax=Streptomyces coerulescens TaxID=29304 RepID=A0ABW0CW84_STRCD